MPGLDPLSTVNVLVGKRQNQEASHVTRQHKENRRKCAHLLVCCLETGSSQKELWTQTLALQKPHLGCKGGLLGLRWGTNDHEGVIWIVVNSKACSNKQMGSEKKTPHSVIASLGFSNSYLHLLCSE